MSTLTNTKTPNPTYNPSALKSRYEIRKLEHEHLAWASALLVHSNAFHSTIWPKIYPENVSGRMFEMFAGVDYLVLHQINSGISFGVFDTEYQFKTEEAKKQGGKLLWDSKEPSIEQEQGLKAEGDRLLAQMDFPLVSVALSYDGFNPLDMDKMGSLLALLPHFGLVYHILGSQDPRDPASWQPTGPRQVLMRNATSTRHDYEGEGIMSGLARWLMREAAGKGYRGIQIECLADAVTHVWSTAEAPFKGSVVTEFECETWKDEEGKVAFAPAKQRVTKCYVDLQPKV
ncbi:hypothetical protein N0V83_001872 [Neocucurbitaria cava]|uniref:Uncharacterized protein n=1 Tax=Neocucurbitaria cava TaxID=798079 RepID=A0A9W9CPF1_9PLEO|nr:hypothetical protein N0V83_001872 [Neocucurbitaria cava]